LSCLEVKNRVPGFEGSRIKKKEFRSQETVVRIILLLNSDFCILLLPTASYLIFTFPEECTYLRGEIS
jgi:hypothetical protein